MPTLDEAIALKVEELKGKPVRVGQDIPNPNITYGSLYGDEELKIAVLKASPILQQRVRGIKGDEAVDEEIRRFDEEIKPRRTSRYLRPSLNLTEEELAPSYAQAMKNFRETERAQARARESGYIRGNLPESYLVPRTPFRPFGLDTAMRQQERGFDPRKEIDFEGVLQFKSALAGLGPRWYTPEDLNYTKQYLGTSSEARKENPDIRGKFAERLPGTFAWVNPRNTDDGIAYFEEGKEPVLFDSAFINGTDFLEVALQETPLVASEILIGVKGLNKFDEFLKAIPGDKGWVGRALENVAGNAVLSAGPAGVEFTRLVLGTATGVHDRDVVEMLKDSGLIFFFSYLGNQGIDIALNGIPKLYRGITGRDVSASQINEIKEAIKRQQASKEGKKVKTLAGTDEPVSLLEIDEAIEELSTEIGQQIPKYNPTLAQGSKDGRMADIERLLLQNTSDPRYAKFYEELMKGNEETIQQFFRALFNNLDEDVTGQTVARELTQLWGRQEAGFIKDGEMVIADLIQSLDNVKALGSGKPVLDDVLDKQASSKLFNRFTTRINETARTYKETLATTVDDEITNLGLRDLTFSGRKFRNQIADFFEAGQPSGKMNIGQKQIQKTFNELFPEEMLERLTRYSKGDITLPELNQIRMELNSFASSLDPSQLAERKIFNLVRELQDGMENQMYSVIRNSNISKREADHLIDVFNAQKFGTELANSEIIIGLGRQQPESVINYLFSTGTKGARKNTRVRDFMDFLENTNSQGQIDYIRNSTIDYIKRNFLDIAEETPFNAAKAYQTFLRANRGTLKEIFPEEQFKQVYQTPKAFQKNIIEPLEKINRKIAVLEARYGESNLFNIVSRILATGEKAKASGELIDDLALIDDLLDSATPAERIILEKQISDVTKKYIITKTSDDGLFDVRKLNQLMNEGFAPGELVGRDLSFEGVYGKLLGKDADKFLERLAVLRDIGLRQTEDLTTTAGARRQIQEELTDPKINYLKRFLIPPLTQFGRRVTAGEKLVAERNLRFVSDIMRDEKLFKAYVDTITGRKKMVNFIKLLHTYNKNYMNDIASTLDSYDEVEKEQRPTKKESERWRRAVPQSFEEIYGAQR